MSDFPITQLLDKAIYPHSVDELRLIETHISWVIIAGEFVYKVKKPVNFGFLDFSTLEKRKHFCEEELRLNQRFAKELYLDVIGIRQTADGVVLGCDMSDATEFAVKMRKFDQACEFDQLLASNSLTPDHLKALADELNHFHQHTSVASFNDRYGSAECVIGPVEENFLHLARVIGKGEEENQLLQIKAWAIKQSSSLSSFFSQRKKEGHVRECHGDLHLKNITLWRSKPIMFDCIEFNADFRWIDTVSEIAFLIMDLQFCKQYSLAQGFLNRYLECSGDYKGLRLLKYYLCYRAMVRAKVSGLRLRQQLTADDERVVQADMNAHLKLAFSYTRKTNPCVLLMYGLSGSGKSTVAKPLAEEMRAIVIRSDVERKRLFKTDRIGEAPELYSKGTTQRTYDYLREQSGHILAGGFPVIVDATFQNREFRQQFVEFARELACPIFIVHCFADEQVLRQRLVARTNDVSDADIRVLEQQLLAWKGLEKSELPYVIDVDTNETVDVSSVARRTGCFGFHTE